MAPPRKKRSVNCDNDQPCPGSSPAAAAESSPAADQLTEMPLEILWIILQEAAILSSTADIDADFQHVLTSLARVCRRFYQVVRDPAFYQKFLKELLARDAAQSCRRQARAVELSLQDVNRPPIELNLSVRFAVLEDEIFVANDRQSQHEICVYDLKPLDGHDRGRDRICSISVMHLRTFSAPTASFGVLESCDMNQCLYISPEQDEDREPDVVDIYRVSPADGRVLAHWTLGGQLHAFRMSVCQTSGNVCVPDAVNGCIVEFDAVGRQTRLIDVSGIVPTITLRMYVSNGLNVQTLRRQRYVFNVTQTADSTYLVSYRFKYDSDDRKQAVIRARQKMVDGKTTLATQVSASLEAFDENKPGCCINYCDASRCIYTTGFDANVFGAKYGFYFIGRNFELNMITADLTLRRRVRLLSRRRFMLFNGYQLRFDSRKCRLCVMIRGMLLCYSLLRDEFE